MEAAAEYKTQSPSLIISGGKFYRNGIEEKPEFGNAEQIKCLREYERLMDEIEAGIPLTPDFDIQVTADVTFKCACGKVLHKSCEASAEDDIECFENESVTCSQCRQRWLFFIDDSGDEDVLRAKKV
jgi:hypothetical protein